MKLVEQQNALNELLTRRYRTIKLEWREDLKLLRVRTRVQPIQCYSFDAMAELQQMLDDVVATQGLVRHFVMSSDVPQVFSFGGDLSLFVQLVRSRDRESLLLYGKQCIDLVWWMENASQHGVHTTVLVEGDALGGGLECALSFHYVVFEQSARGGYPEVFFNLFPGMGAWHFTIRRAGFTVAKQMIVSGHVYTATELYQRGLVDLVIPDGQGDIAIEKVARSVDPKLRGTLAAFNAQRTAAPISYESLQAVVEQWVDAALNVTDDDLRIMERLARMQIRKLGGARDGAVEEIKRLELEGAWDRHRSSVQRTGVTGFGSL